MGRGLQRKADPQIIRENYAAFEEAKAAFGVQSISKKKHNGAQSAYFDKRTCGFYVLQEGHNFQPHEIEAAKILARHGYCVTMQPESKEKGGISLRRSPQGGETFPEGRIGALWYEQYSSGASTNTDVKNSLKHAHKKGAIVAVLFCHSSPISSIEIERGLRRHYGQEYKESRTVKTLIVIAKSLRHKGYDVIERDVLK